MYQTYLMLIDEMIFIFYFCRLCFTAAGINKYFVGAGASRVWVESVNETQIVQNLGNWKQGLHFFNFFSFVCVCVYKFSSGE